MLPKNWQEVGNGPESSGKPSAVVPDTIQGKALAFIAEYPAVAVFGLLLLYIVFKRLRSKASRSGSTQQPRSTARKAVLGGCGACSKGTCVVHGMGPILPCMLCAPCLSAVEAHLAYLPSSTHAQARRQSQSVAQLL